MSDTPPVVLGEAKIIAFLATTDAPVAFDAGGAMLRIQKVRAFTPQPFTALGWRVPDIAAAVDALVAKGVRLARYDSLPQDERGIWTTGNGDRICWFQDPDGNTLSLTQFTDSG